MSVDARQILEAARALPPEDQLEILQGLAQSLARSLSPLTSASATFWDGPTIEELAREQHVAAVTDIGALASPAWPDDESTDDFIAYIYEQRSADRDQ
jgi:hypothetical protein